MHFSYLTAAILATLAAAAPLPKSAAVAGGLSGLGSSNPVDSITGLLSGGGGLLGKREAASIEARGGFGDLTGGLSGGSGKDSKAGKGGLLGSIPVVSTLFGKREAEADAQLQILGALTKVLPGGVLGGGKKGAKSK